MLITPENNTNQNNENENVLILQGGGSLGAFGCGVFKALAKNNIHLNIVAGTSIGGVNAAIIAGNRESNGLRAEEALEQFWLELAENSSRSSYPNLTFPFTNWFKGNYGFYNPLDPVSGFKFPSIFPSPLQFSFNSENPKEGKKENNNSNNGKDDPHIYYLKSLFSFYKSATFGNGKMFLPRWLPNYALSDPDYFKPYEWTYIYDHTPLLKTLDKYIDYSKLRPEGRPNARLIITAVNVLTSEPLVFDSAKKQITPKHLLATSGYPLYYFPWVEVEDNVYAWDGSLLSNTPLREVIEISPVIDKIVFLVENYPKKMDKLPENIQEVLHRARDIMFSDKTAHNVKMSKVITHYLQFIDELYYIFENHADHSVLDKKKVQTIKNKYQKFKKQTGAEIKRIHYITREETYPHYYENADFTVETIKQSILDGETKTNEILKLNVCG
ncbi:MAG: patatin-like phospholipase family protein [Thermoproteota archaeon]|nr:patatin-like phospholipase family protein [Thermoproteota archaeon]